MLRTSKLRSAILASLVAASAALPLTASASHSWGGYHWARTSSPFTLINLAALRGNEAAKSYRQEIASELTRAQVGAAQKRAREWLSKH